MKKQLPNLLHLTFRMCFILSTILCTLPAYANGVDAQMVETEKNVPLNEALDKLAELYEVSMIYDSEQVSGKTVELFQPKKQSIEKDLTDLLGKFSLRYKKIGDDTFIVVAGKLNVDGTLDKTSEIEKAAEKVKVIGVITDDESGETLIGVNILEVGKGNGTVSDYDGSYSITVEKGSILSFSYTGYLTKEIKIVDGGRYDIILENNAAQLEEVVVVGYGTQKRSDLTGSLSSVSSEELKALPSTGLDQALQGRAAGVLVTQNSGAPGGAVSIRIRGIGSTLTAEPLYVIDGVPVVNDNQGTSANFSELDGGGQNTNALNTINPNDIESIEILKDASATAIYGSRGANGVVLITTKRGKNGKSALAFETYFGVQEIGKKIDVLNLREYSEYLGDVASYIDIEEFENPELLGEGTDWQEEIFRRAQMQNYQLTMSGGSEKTSFALSGGFHQKEGIVIGSKFDRMSAKVNLDHKFSKRVRIGNSLLVSRTNERIVFNDNSNGVVYTGLLMVPNAPVRNADGSFAGPQEEITLSFDNPVARALETDDRNRKTRILSNIYAEIDLLPFLKYRTEFGADVVYSNHNTFYPSFQRGNFFGKSKVNRSLSNNNYWINKHLLTFNKKIGQKSDLTLLGGYEAQSGKYEYIFASRDNLPNNDLRELNLGDAGQQVNGGGAGHWALMSYFGRMNYNFDDRYLATATVRTDGSSRFGENNRFGTFISGALAWRISNERFLKDVEAIDNLKLRIGYGTTGNQEIGFYSYSGNLRSITTVLGDQFVTAFAPDNIANPDVRWETSLQSNIGFDLGLFKNRVELIMDYYVKEAQGMLLPALVPATAGGLNPRFVNIGEVKNSGLETTINTQNFTGKFAWKTSLNFSVNRNEVISLGSNGNLVGIIQRLPVTRTEEGMAISQFYGYRTDGIFQNQAEVAEHAFQSDNTRAGDIRFKDLDGDGVITDADQEFIGSPHPDFTLNVSNSFNYKGFDLNIFVQSVYGNEILNLIRRDTEGMVNSSNQTSAVVDRYTTLEPSTTVPRAIGTDPNDNRRISDRFIEDGSFIRLKNITLGYNFSRAMSKRLKMQSLRAYVSTQNLKTWTNYSGYDPEIGSFNQNPLINGVENGRYPISRSITVGLNASF